MNIFSTIALASACTGLTPTLMQDCIPFEPLASNPELCVSGLLSVAGAVSPVCLPPPSIEQDQYEGYSVRVIEERTDLLLEAPLLLDAAGAGCFDTDADLIPGKIGAGEIVSSYLVHYDPVDLDSWPGSIHLTFEGEVAGLILTTSRLDATDSVLGLAEVAYPIAPSQRGLELNTSAQEDAVWISEDLHTLELSLSVVQELDQLRVVTTAAAQLTVYENDPSGWLIATAGSSVVTLDFDNVAGSTSVPIVGNEFLAELSCPILTDTSGNGIFVGNPAPGQVPNPPSPPNMLSPACTPSCEGVIRVSFSEPVRAVSAIFIDVEADFASTGLGLSLGAALPDVAFSSPQGQGTFSFLGVVSIVPFTAVDIHFATGANIDGVLIDDLAYATTATHLLASETIRQGVPPNPAALSPGQTSGPVIGAMWDPVIDHTTFMPGALVDVLALGVGPVNIPAPPLGTLLCDPAGPLQLVQSAAGIPFSVLVPSDCSLVGVTLCTQGVSINATAIALTNGLDITIGTF
ncbi:hypothetical protein [Engelhardtia mirabilis]|uniref:Uncharacterized protein n=1 Tax=Engelhardtia mirabilis TaxID=2528011 RepID=A0A518BH05_9BACT|nr:hypothetical protein Pla133_13000 [Planctomycetes bacterium Pla133]QDV00561.1 hypothetical protein Pla86_13000 [Planctomycetes bacterium Pla86]